MSALKEDSIGKEDRKHMQVMQQIFHNLLEVAELYPTVPLTQHLAAIFRRKSTEGPNFFYWSNEDLLKKIEKYRDEVETEDFLHSETEED